MSDTYLIHVCRLPQSTENLERINRKSELSANTGAFISCRRRLTIMHPLTASASVMINLILQLMKATVLGESSVFSLFFLNTLHSVAVCRHESSRYRSFLPLSTNFFSHKPFLYSHFFSSICQMCWI